ncbi:MAG: LamG-like jellyroll fold domain-containing protein [Candidatus Eisenbacteria bacterium]
MEIRNIRVAVGPSPATTGARRIVALVLLAASSLTTPGRADLTDGLVAHYEFEGNADDSIGGHDGQEHGVSYVEGRIGTAISFDGTSYANVPATGWLTPLETFSIAAWVRAASFPAEQGYPFVHDRQNGDASPNKHLEFRLYQNILYSGWESSSGTDSGLQYDGFWSEFGSTWVHVALTRDMTGTGRLYVNGALADSVQGAVETGNSDDLMFGAIRTTGTEGSETLFFHGDLDDARIYSRALSGEEVRALYLEVDDPASVAGGPGGALPIRLGAPYPNPASARTEFTVTTEVDQAARIDIVDANGRLVETVFEGRFDRGSRTLGWTPDAKLPNGAYHLRLRAGRVEVGRSVIVLR